MRSTQLTPEQTNTLIGLIQDGHVSLQAATYAIANIQGLIASELWPEATDSSAIVTTEPQKLERARSIINSITPLTDKKFLDFGCGEGHAVTAAADNASLAIGYDPVQQWSGRTDLFTDLAAVTPDGPFDVILSYDVIDHICDQDGQIAALNTIGSLLNPNGVVHMRCHPYTSRHSTHSYTALNRAFLQLFLSYDEIEAAGWPCQRVFVTHFPLRHYDTIIAQSGLTVKERHVRLAEVPPIMFQDEIADILRKNPTNGQKTGLVNYSKVLEIEFVDFVLARSLQQAGNTPI